MDAVCAMLCGGLKGKTVAIDGKTVCGTDKLTKDGSVLHIASTIVSELKLVIGSQECTTKTGEIKAFRELIDLLDVEGGRGRCPALQPKVSESSGRSKSRLPVCCQRQSRNP